MKYSGCVETTRMETVVVRITQYKKLDPNSY